MKELERYRRDIDALDEQLIDLFARRFDIVRAVGNFKAKNDVAVVQSKRAEAVKMRAVQMAEERGVDGDFIRMLYESMIDVAHDIENEILKNAGVEHCKNSGKQV